MQAFNLHFTRTLKKAHHLWDIQKNNPLLGVPYPTNGWFYRLDDIFSFLVLWSSDIWEYSLSSEDISFNLNQKPQTPKPDEYIHYR